MCVFRYRGQIGASLILGGVDCTGNHLYKVGPYGSIDNVPYLAMGEGLLLCQANISIHPYTAIVWAIIS